MWTEKMTQIIKEQFVPVAVAGHVANDRKDADGEFLRKTGIRLAGAGGNMECLTASGIRLGSFYPAGGTAVNEREAEATLKKFRDLPEKERLPGAVKVPEQGQIAANVQSIQPPKGALILRTFHRVLTREADGKVRKTAVTDYPKESKLADKDDWRTFFGERWEAQPDYMWIRQEEWQVIVKPSPAKGQTYPLLDAVADRMTRAHMLSGPAYGECGICSRSEVRSSKFTVTVTDVAGDVVQLRLEGSAALGADEATSEKLDKKGKESDGRSVQGYEPQVLGYLTYDMKKKVFKRFDIVALGNAYGTPGGAYYFYYRPGRYPIGIALEIAAPVPAERVPPRASVVYTTPNPEYFATGRK